MNIHEVIIVVSNSKCYFCRYTNHCLRSTSIGILDAGGLEGRQIIRITGHKSEGSIKSYSRNLTSAKKREISSTVAKALASEPEDITDIDISDDMLLSMVDFNDNLVVNPIAPDYCLLTDQVQVNCKPSKEWQNVVDVGSSKAGKPVATQSVENVVDVVGSSKAGKPVATQSVENVENNVMFNFSPQQTNNLMRAININNSVVNIYQCSSNCSK